jgi:hypothetical protein
MVAKHCNTSWRLRNATSPALDRILPKPSRRHDHPPPDRAVTDALNAPGPASPRSGPIPARRFAGLIACGLWARKEPCRSLWCPIIPCVRATRRSPQFAPVPMPGEGCGNAVRVADPLAPTMVAAAVVWEGGLCGIVAGHGASCWKQGTGQLGKPWVRTCPAHHGLRAVANSSRG